MRSAKFLLVSAAALVMATAAQAEIKIGSVLSYTGPASFLGDPEKKTLEMYVAEINAKGGLLGRKVELKILDDQSNADRVVSDYEQLIGSDKVDLLFGPFSTRLVVPSARVAGPGGGSHASRA